MVSGVSVLVSDFDLRLYETSANRITEKIEHRTLNIERPTSNNEFYHFKKLGKANESFKIIGISNLRFACLKMTKRSVINIGCSMLSVRCSTFIGYFPDLNSRLFRQRQY